MFQLDFRIQVLKARRHTRKYILPASSVNILDCHRSQASMSSERKDMPDELQLGVQIKYIWYLLSK